MNFVDRALQRYRFRVARRWLPPGASLLDIGAHQGELLAWLGPRIAPSTGIDDVIERDRSDGRHRLLAGQYPERRPDAHAFDAATLLAVVEHLSDEALLEVGHAIAADLKSGGRVVVTVPSPMVDRLLAVLMRLRILHGMDADAHHAFDVDALPRLWSPAGLLLVERHRFQLGLNNLLVFERQA